MCTFWLGLRGLTPSRAARFAVENFPKPVNVIESPFWSASVTHESTASTAALASRRERFDFDATASTNSCFVTCHSSCSWMTGNPPGTLTAPPDWLNHAGFRRFLPRARVLLPGTARAASPRLEPTRPLLLPRDRRRRPRFAPPGRRREVPPLPRRGRRPR